MELLSDFGISILSSFSRFSKIIFNICLNNCKLDRKKELISTLYKSVGQILEDLVSQEI